MKIAIKFGDNDFYNCFTGVLKTLLEAKKWYSELPTDKEKLSIIINEISYGCYLLFQNQFEYGKEYTTKTIDITLKEYLKISPKNILLNEEVDEYFKGEYIDTIFVLDTNLDYDGNEAIHTYL